MSTIKPSNIDRNSLYVLEKREKIEKTSETKKKNLSPTTKTIATTTINMDKETTDNNNNNINNIISLRDLVMDYVLHRSLMMMKKNHTKQYKSEKLNNTIIKIEININNKEEASPESKGRIVEYNCLKLVEEYLELRDNKYRLDEYNNNDNNNNNSNSTIETLVDEIMQFVQNKHEMGHINDNKEGHNLDENNDNDDYIDKDKVISHVLNQHFNLKQRLCREKDLQILKAKSIKSYLNQLNNNRNRNNNIISEKESSPLRLENYLPEYLQAYLEEEEEEEKEEDELKQREQKLQKVNRENNMDSFFTLESSSISTLKLKTPFKKLSQNQSFKDNNNKTTTKSKLTELIDTCKVFQHPEKVEQLRKEKLRELYDGMQIDAVVNEVEMENCENIISSSSDGEYCKKADNNHSVDNSNKNNNNENATTNTENDNNTTITIKFLTEWINDITISEKLFSKKLESRTRKEKQHTEIIVKIGKLISEEELNLNHEINIQEEHK